MNELLHKRKLFLVEGIVFVILGIIAIFIPGVFTWGAEILFGALILLGGVAQLVRAVQARHAPGFVISLISSLAYIVLGGLFLAKPILGVLTLTLLVLLFFIIEGFFKIAMAFELRQVKGWGWLLLSGILALVMAGLIWSGWPGTAFWVIGLLLGIDMIFFGLSLIGLYQTLRTISK